MRMPPRPSVSRGRSELVEAAPRGLRCLLGGDDVVGLQRPDVVAGPVRDRVPVGGSPSSPGKATAPPPPAPRRPASPRWRSAQRAALAPRRPARRALRCRCPRASRRRWRRAGGTARASCRCRGWCGAPGSSGAPCAAPPGPGPGRPASRWVASPRSVQPGLSFGDANGAISLGDAMRGHRERERQWGSVKPAHLSAAAVRVSADVSGSWWPRRRSSQST